MAIKTLPSRALLHQLLRYDAETGDLIWLARERELFANNGAFLSWNNRYPGTIAGSVKPQSNPRYSGYLHIGFSGHHWKAHRLIWLHVRGEPVPDMIDHKDRDTLNNRIENLRAATKRLNVANSGVRSSNKLGVKGVWRTKYGKFVAKAGGSYLGTFATADEAAATCKAVASDLYGEFAWTNHSQK